MTEKSLNADGDETPSQRVASSSRSTEQAISSLDTTLRDAIKRGDKALASRLLIDRLLLLVGAGRALDEVWRETLASLALALDEGLPAAVDAVALVQAFVQALQGRQAAPLQAVSDALATSSGWVLSARLLLELQRTYLFDELDAAAAVALRLAAMGPAMPSDSVLGQLHLFHDALVAAALYSHVPQEQRPALADRLRSGLAAIESGVSQPALQSEHRGSLLRAELARIEKRFFDALTLYELASRQAADDAAARDEGIANELAARLCKAEGMDRMADCHVTLARAAFDRWGAQAKVARLDGLQASAASPPTFGMAIRHLDLSEIVEVSLSLSGEMSLDRLIDRLMQLALEKSGADRGVLVIRRAGALRIEAEALAMPDGPILRYLGRAADESDLPLALVKRADETRKVVVVQDAYVSQGELDGDYWSRRGARSAVCLPLVKQGEFVGALHLESRHAAETRDARRCAALALLTSQAAVSLQNALLYADLERENTERRQSEEALRLSQERHALSMEAAADGHGEWVAADDVFRASPRMIEQWGLSPQLEHCRRGELLSQFPFHPDDRARVVALLDAGLKGKDRRLEFDARMLRGDETRWMHVNVLYVRDATGQATRIAVATTDVTDRMRAEEDLRASEERYALAFAGSEESIFDWDLHKRQIYLPQRTQELLGMAPGEPWRTLEDLSTSVPFHPGDAVRQRAAMDAHAAGLIPMVDIELRVLMPDGVRWLHQRGRALRDDAGKAQRVVGSIGDITDRKREQEELQRLESRLRQAERFDALGTLAGGIAHDFNNILGAILGFGERALRSAAGDHLRSDVSHVIQAGQRGRVLVDRILSFSRGTAGARVPVDVQAVVARVAGDMAARLTTNLKLRLHLDAEGVRMPGNDAQVQQLVESLLNNAARAMPKGGTMDLILRTESLARARPVRIGIVGAGDWIVLEVQDEGIGIAGDMIDRVFDPFYSTWQAGVGTGLGLSLALRIVKQAGGAIDVRSEVERGSTFSIFMPRSAETVGDDSGVPAGIARGQGQRVLVIDDEASLLDLTSEALRRLGYRPEPFESGTEAIAAFRGDPSGYDAIVSGACAAGSDCQVLLREMRRERPLVPVILLTSEGEQATPDERTLALADEVLPRPWSIEHLAGALSRLLAYA